MEEFDRIFQDGLRQKTDADRRQREAELQRIRDEQAAVEKAMYLDGEILQTFAVIAEAGRFAIEQYDKHGLRPLRTKSRLRRGQNTHAAPRGFYPILSTRSCAPIIGLDRGEQRTYSNGKFMEKGVAMDRQGDQMIAYDLLLFDDATSLLNVRSASKVQKFAEDNWTNFNLKGEGISIKAYAKLEEKFTEEKNRNGRRNIMGIIMQQCFSSEFIESNTQNDESLTSDEALLELLPKISEVASKAIIRHAAERVHSKK